MKKMIIGLTLGMLIGSTSVALAAPSTVQAIVAKFTITVDGQKQTLKTNPLIYNGTTYLPVREVAGMLNADVTSFDNKTKKIELKTKRDNGTMIVATEWVSTNDLNRLYGIGINMGKDTTITYRNKTIVFPLSMDDKDTDSKVYTNAENTASLKIENGVMYLGKDALSVLGIK